MFLSSTEVRCLIKSRLYSMYLGMQNTGCMDPVLWNLNFRVQFKITTNGKCPLNFKWSVAYQCIKKFQVRNETRNWKHPSRDLNINNSNIVCYGILQKRHIHKGITPLKSNFSPKFLQEKEEERREKEKEKEGGRKSSTLENQAEIEWQHSRFRAPVLSFSLLRKNAGK